MKQPQSLAVSVMRHVDALIALRPEWLALWQSAGVLPFQHPDWLIPWWSEFHDGTLNVIVVRDGERLVGVVPLYLALEEAGAWLRPLGVGMSDRLDPLAADGYGVFVADRALRWLAEQRGTWDGCYLPGLAPDASLAAAPSRGLASTLHEEDPCPVLALDPDLSAIPTQMKAKLRYYSRRAEGLGEVRFETAAPDRVIASLETLAALHGRRWRERGCEGVFADHRVLAFHRKAAPRLAGAGILRMHVLTIGGAAAAILYGFNIRGRAWYYIGGFDPALAEASPGSLVVAHAIAAAAAEQAHSFDFLRGRETYKYRWGATDQPLFARTLHSAP
jgi:CelD/BcsL family acetyltransferase involved in cellulose biosynthesis